MAGNVGFDFVNESSKVNELYVLKANGDTLGEVENVTTETSRTLTVDLVAGGDTIRFAMTNNGDQPHEFEVIEPDGEPIGEVAAMNPGDSGGATMTFVSPGVYTSPVHLDQCILVDSETGQPHTELGMIGTFEVTGG